MILVTGSLAYDYIMTYGEKFEDALLASGLSNLSVSFFIDSVHKHRGGTAGNIAYNLKLLQESPVLMATAGYDFSQYQEDLHLHGINNKYVSVLEDQTTASGFSTTDVKGNQIWMFHPGAMDHAVKHELAPIAEKIRFAIIAPEIQDTMMHYVRECKKNGINYIFDPGQNIHTFSKEHLLEGIDGAYAVIMNEYEWQLFGAKTEMTKEEVILKAQHLIITLGEKGSKIFSAAESMVIDPIPVQSAKDPTGCGDAYRAGFIKGMSDGLSLKDAGKIASMAASFCLEEHGTQNHNYSWEEFEKRLNSVI